MPFQSSSALPRARWRSASADVRHEFIAGPVPVRNKVSHGGTSTIKLSWNAGAETGLRMFYKAGRSKLQFVAMLADLVEGQPRRVEIGVTKIMGLRLGDAGRAFTAELPH